MATIEVLGVKDTIGEENKQYEKALKSAEEAFKEVYGILEADNFISKEGWKKEVESDKDVVYSKRTDTGKLFAIRSEMPGDVEMVFNDLFNGFNEIPQWHSKVEFSKYVARPTEHVNIVHYGTREFLTVSGRDYVTVEIYRKTNEKTYVMAGKSIELPDLPEKKPFVRADMRIGGGRLTQKEGDPGTTIIDYLLCLDLKGNLPMDLINKFMGRLILLDYAELRKHLAKLKAAK
ncbi:hypothetical protein AB6A40_007497 [Gnathostoma spinigerum]|uniref:START domain-containing protein n=1 Tax=Gnathostoma spinigerum TaxID=75299 RepID=A0ABD6EUR4_9BILA